jgi:hypothetical protein
MSQFSDNIQRLVNEKGEAFASEYLRTYCEVMLDDPTVDESVKKKIRGVLDFLRKYDEKSMVNKN